MKTLFTLLSFILLTSLNLQAQDTWNWGPKEKEARGTWMYLTNLVNQGKLVEAAKPCNWLLINAPEANKALYVQAAKIYKKKIKVEKEPSVKIVLQDSLLAIFDKRIELYGDKANVLNRKGKVAWIYQYKDKTKHDDLYKLYKDIYTLNNSKTSTANLFYYFASASRQLKKGNINQTELLTLFGTLNSELDSQSANASEKKLTSIEKYRSKLDTELNKYVVVDCDFVNNNYGTKFQSSPSISGAHKIQSLLSKNKCYNELYINVTTYLIKEEGPSYASLRTLGNIYAKQHQTDSAYAYYSRAVTNEAEDKKLGRTYMDMAKIDMHNNRKSAARENIRHAINKNPGLASEGHTLIGNLYMESANTCNTGDALESRLAYIAAYNEYKLAGNNNKMNQAHNQFPSMEDIFVRNKKVGEPVKTGCWINETVSLDIRD